MNKVTTQAEDGSVDQSKVEKQLEALERIFSGPKWDVRVNGRMPTAEERNSRPWHKRIGLPYLD